MENLTYHVYTDGACSGNKVGEGLGGYAYLIIDKLSERRWISSGHVKNTTNNIMELVAVIAALKTIVKKHHGDTHKISCVVHSDSKYVVDGYTSYLPKWLKNGWLSSDDRDIANKMYWEVLSAISFFFKSVKFKWIRGHDKDEYNKLVDKLANTESQKLKAKCRER